MRQSLLAKNAHETVAVRDIVLRGTVFVTNDSEESLHGARFNEHHIWIRCTCHSDFLMDCQMMDQVYGGDGVWWT